MRYYPKGSWNVRLRVDIDVFVDTWMKAVETGMNYGDIAKELNCKKIDVEFAEARLRKVGLQLPKLNLENNDDSEFCFCGI